MDSNSVSRINQMTEEMKEYLNEKLKSNPNMTKVIVIGDTGCGKTALINVLLNNNVNIELFNGQVNLITQSEISSFQSCTIRPKVFINTASCIAYLDFPGFLDTRGEELENVYANIIDYLLTMPPNGKFKILLVFSDICLNRRCPIINSINMKIIKKVLPNHEQIKKHLGIVITKGSSKMSASDYIELLDDYPRKTEDCNYIFDKNPDHIFIFPKPKRKNIGQRYKFDDHEKLISFLKKS